MKIRIDFSIITADGEAIGNIEGVLDCVVLPMVGDTLCFMSAPNGADIPPGHEFGGHLKVTDRVISPNLEGGGVTILLGDMVAESKMQAMALANYFERDYGLFANIYD